jgi:long-chain acyl-CoA synthetase
MTTATKRDPTALGERATTEPRTVYELFRQVTTSRPDEVAYRVKRDDAWDDITWSANGAVVERIARSLVALGVERGDRVALMGSTRLEWVQCDSAIACSGAVTVGIYHSNLAPECGYILERSGAKLLFVENDTQLQKALEVRADLPELAHIVVWDGEGGGAEGVLGWQAFLERGADVPPERIEQLGRQIEPDDLASLVFTSGTTGAPKGAMISHANLVFTAKAANEALYVEPHFCTLLFLPLAHVYARAIVYMCQRSGLTVAFAEDFGRIPIYIKEIRPHFIAAVPRLYEKIHEKVVSTAEDAGGVKAKLFGWAVEVGRQAARLRLAHRPLPVWLRLKHALADRLVLHKLRDALGGRLVWAASGAAPLSVDVNEFFHACGVTIVEGLGMTENTSLSNANRLNRIKLGTVGPVVDGVEMKIAEDGEVLFRGPNVMLGYYRDREATVEVIDPDGWLHSGDIGEIDADGFLAITDRKKDLIITAGGKNVAPQRVEKVLGASRYIGHVVAIGDRRKFISALIALDPENIGHWASEQGLNSRSLAELSREPRVAELIEAELARGNRELASFESVKKFRILPEVLSIEAGDLTPTMKVRRRVVCEKYRALLEEMYGE